MKTRIIKILFISLLFSAKIFPAAEIEEEQDLQLTNAILAGESLEKIRRLVEENANVNETSERDNPALLIATSMHRKDIVKFLLEKNASVNQSNPKGHLELLLYDPR